nr:50S ribosomal protein L24 [Maliibacterium massiliense]
MSIPKKLHVKTGDTVAVISGANAGKSGKVLACFPKEGRVIVEGVNIITRHTKPRGQQNQGGRIQKEAPIYASKVMLYCDKCKRGVRVGHKVEDGKKVRVCKRCGKTFEA